ncbi:MAG: hypothetical protein DME80_04215 [Verrucomicrobia bacterium]|nr:MAG: hypothetical protein DME80_04215 [Verrucomicrobiota bacterium]
MDFTMTSKRFFLLGLLLVIGLDSTGREPIKSPPPPRTQANVVRARDLGIPFEQTSVQCKWVLNHQFIEFHYGAADAKPEYEAFVFIGLDEAAKTYVCHWVDVFGGKDSELGRGKIDDKLLAIEFKFGNGDLTNKFTFDPKTKTWTSLIRQQEKGESKTFAEEKWTRK